MKGRLRGRGTPDVHWGSAVPWLLPYLVIWTGTAAVVRVFDLRPSCTGFCALYAGFQTYAILLSAAVLSAGVATAELYLWRPR